MTPLPDWKLRQLVGRLWDACERQEWIDPDLWSRGLEKFEEKYGFRLILDKFESADMTEAEAPEMTITITTESNGG